uniref:replication initiation and membrane attachment family protein n=1 Tax=Candidatus Ventrenecus sp. TaxID=3085654 RepID=UPI0040250AA8
MAVVTLLPADKYMIVNKTILTDQDRKYLVSLYEPIIGSLAVSLYLTLWRDLDRYTFVSADYNHHHLMTILKTNLDSIKLARQTLEGVGLLRTYFMASEPNNYVYELYSPMNPKEFFQNPIFNVVLYNNIGAFEYNLLKKEYSVLNINLKGYEEVTSHFDEVFKSSSELPSIEALGRETLPLNMQDQIDFDLLISSLPKGMLNEKILNKRMRSLINNLSFVYNIDTLKMCEIIRLSINEKGAIDKDTLRLQTRKYYQYNNHGKLPTLIYRAQPEYLKSPSGDTSKKGRIIEVFENTTPYDFLCAKYKTGTPTVRDLKLLEYLLEDVGLKPAVVNVLIDYVLKKNNNKLNNAFVETIAGQWKRLGIETAKDAMEVAEKEHKKYINKFNKVSVKKVNEEPPVWFDEKISKESMTEEEEKELESMLKKYE